MTHEGEHALFTAGESGMVRSAWLSDDGIYRYSLTRRWGDGAACTFAMLNPSTADAQQDDPTIRRCIGFARRWGYDAVHVINVYAYRATDPKELTRAARRGEDIAGPLNAECWARQLRASRGAGTLLIAAWGAHPSASRGAAWRLRGSSARWHVLGLTKDGHPRHPLYVRGDSQPQPWCPLGGKP